MWNSDDDLFVFLSLCRPVGAWNLLWSCFLGRCPRLACGCPFGAESQWVFTNTTLLLTHLPSLFDHELQLLNSRLTLMLRRQAIDQL